MDPRAVSKPVEGAATPQGSSQVSAVSPQHADGLLCMEWPARQPSAGRTVVQKAVVSPKGLAQLFRSGG